MQQRSKKMMWTAAPLGFSILMFSISLIVLYPFCKYYIDPDATAYLVIIKRYAESDYYRAFNGLWSPLHPFLSSLFVRFAGLSAYGSALLVNIAAALCVLISGFRLFVRVHRRFAERFLFGAVMAIYWAVSVYFQLVADLLALGLTLVITNLLIDKDFFRSRFKWWMVGLLTGIMLYAKSYNSYAFILILFGIIFYFYRHGDLSLKRSLAILGGVLVPTILLALPYAWLTYLKYGIFAPGTTGKLNMEWSVVGTQLFKEDIKVFVPPPYEDSISYWEDPFWSQGGWHGIFSSPKYFFRYLLRIGYNITSWISEMGHLSFFYTTTWMVLLMLAISKLKNKFADIKSGDKTLVVLIILSLLYPSGLLLVGIEARYLWSTLIPVIILGLYLYQQSLWRLLPKFLDITFLLLFFGSFLVGASRDVRSMINTGKKEYGIAAKLAKYNIKGSFFANKAGESEMMPEIRRIAHFSNNPFYYYPRTIWTTEELLKDAQRHGVSHFYYFYDGLDSQFQLLDLEGNPLPELTKGKIPGLSVFKLHDSEGVLP